MLGAELGRDAPDGRVVGTGPPLVGSEDQPAAIGQPGGRVLDGDVDADDDQRRLDPQRPGTDGVDRHVDLGTRRRPQPEQGVGQIGIADTDERTRLGRHGFLRRMGRGGDPITIACAGIRADVVHRAEAAHGSAVDNGSRCGGACYPRRTFSELVICQGMQK